MVTERTGLAACARIAARPADPGFQDLTASTLTQTPHRAHWQPTEYNALHGGFERWFDPVEASVAEAPAWIELLTSLGRLFAQVKPVTRWISFQSRSCRHVKYAS